MANSLVNSGILFIVSAASGTGKTTIINSAIKQIDNLTIPVSYTTRPPREGEIDGQHYHFIEHTKFLAMIKNNEFLEYAEIYGYLYGSSKLDLEMQLAKGKDLIVAIDWQGAKQLTARIFNTVSIFILPPSMEILQQRLFNRKQDSDKVIADRMQLAKSNILHYQDYQYVIVNDELQKAIAQLLAIVQANRLAVKHRKIAIEQFVNNLL